MRVARLAGPRDRLVCFNQPLAKMLHDELAGTAAPGGDLEVLTFHELCLRMGRTHHLLPSPEPIGQDGEWFDKTLPGALEAAIEREREPYHAIVVDEGQDFERFWLEPLDLLLRQPGEGVLHIFHDPGEELVRIFHDVTAAEATEVFDALVERVVPTIWTIGDRRRVLVSGLSMKDKALLLLYSAAGWVPAADLVADVKHSNASVFRRDVLRTADQDGLVEYHEVGRRVHLSPLGVKYVEERLGTHLAA